MSDTSLVLSASGIGMIPFENYTDIKFRLIAGSSNMIILGPIADFFSPKIAKLHTVDPTLDCLILSKKETSSNLLSDDIQNVLLQIITKGMGNIDHEKSIKLRILSIILENEELYHKIDQIFPICGNNLNSPIDYLLNLYQYEFYSDRFIFREDECIKFISKNFYKYEKVNLLKLPKTILYSIISNKELIIQSEDYLFDFINELFSSNSNESEIDITTFYEQIDYNFLSDDKFIQFINTINSDQINSQIWSEIQNTLTLKLKCINTQNNSKHKYRIILPYNGKDKFDGIIRYLTNKCKGNIVDKGSVKVTYTSQGVHKWPENFRSEEPRYAVELDNKNHYFDSCPTTNPNDTNYIKYDFFDRKILLKSYSIRSRHDKGKGDGHFKDWVVEGANDDSDEKKWIRLDTKKDDFSIDDKSKENVFQISNNNEENNFFRFIRIGCIKNSFGNNALVFSALEFFGTLEDK